MAYDWKNEAEREGGNHAAKVPPGEHDLAVAKIIHVDKYGAPFESKGGDPQMMLVYIDREGRECTDFLTLNDAAGWRLAKLLQAMKLDMAEFTRRGMTPRDFADQDIAKEWLDAQIFRARVSYTRKGEREFAEVTPIRPEPVAVDDIPL